MRPAFGHRVTVSVEGYTIRWAWETAKEGTIDLEVEHPAQGTTHAGNSGRWCPISGFRVFVGHSLMYVMVTQCRTEVVETIQ